MKDGVSMWMVWMPSPGALPSFAWMKATSFGAAAFRMSTTWTPLYLHIAPPQAAR